MWKVFSARLSFLSWEHATSEHAGRHTGCLRLKDSLTSPLSLVKAVPLVPGGKNILISRDGGTGQASEPTGLPISSPWFTTPISYLLVLLYLFHDFLLLVKSSIKMLRFNPFFRSSFPYEGASVT